ncbi:MAG: pentapeptide repeat-containing protein, partial [Planctomycetota bacterium]|nr:pentapeptide repeat-containing protein [Planctomycetota bacterium]
LPSSSVAQVPQQFDLRGVDFRGVGLGQVNFAGRDLTGSYMRDANLTGACLWRSRLDRVDLRGTKGLTKQQLASAIWDFGNPPQLDVELNRFRRFWERRRADSTKLPGVNLWGAELGGFNFVDSDLRGAVFVGARLRSAVFLRARLRNAVFAGADLTGADLRAATGLTAGQLVSASWDPADPPRLDDRLNLVRKLFEQKNLGGQDLTGLRMFGRDLRKANFTGCKLVGAAFLGSDLRDAVLRDADLTAAVLTGTDISGADFRGSRGLRAVGLFAAHWDPGSPPLLDAKLNLARRMFEHGSLAGFDLRDGNFWDADLSKARLQGCQLANTVLIGANLRGATLTDADLSGAVLLGADLTGADLRTTRSLTAGQLLSAKWTASKPPKLSRELEVIRKMWHERNPQGHAVQNAYLWHVDLKNARLHGGKLTDMLFVRADLRNATFSGTDLRGSQFIGADISGVDFRGARNLSLQSLMSAVWDLTKPPTMDDDFKHARKFFEKRRIEFNLTGATLHKLDPDSVVGPPRPTDRFARFGITSPPRLGVRRLIELLRSRDYRQLWFDK